MKLDRRTVLRGAGGIAVALPLLEAMMPRRAAAAGATARRLVLLYSANGTVRESWRPTGGEADFQLSPILAPLGPHRKELLVIEGLDQQNGGPGDQHQRGSGGLFTGQPLNTGKFRGGNGEHTNVGWANGPSIDQVVAGRIGTKTRFKTRELGVGPSQHNPWGRVFYQGPDQPIPPEVNPANTFRSLFSDVGADPLALTKLRAQRKTVLDAVLGEYRSLKPRLGAEDARKIDAHFTAIEDIEARLQVGAEAGARCEKPATPAGLDHAANDNFPKVSRLQMDLAVLAMACDLVRVVAIQWSRPVSEVRFTWLGIPEGHHTLSHRGDSDADARGKLVRINTWYATEMAYLLTRLKATVDPAGGTLFDGAVVMWGNELGKGNDHSRDDAPYVIASGAGTPLRTGRYLRHGGTVPHNNLLVSVVNAFGIETRTFGKPEWCTGPLGNLT